MRRDCASSLSKLSLKRLRNCPSLEPGQKLEEKEAEGGETRTGSDL